MPAAQAECKIIHILEEEIQGLQHIETGFRAKEAGHIRAGGSASDITGAMMLIPAPNLRLYIATGSTDMRKAINGGLLVARKKRTAMRKIREVLRLHFEIPTKWN